MFRRLPMWMAVIAAAAVAACTAFSATDAAETPDGGGALEASTNDGTSALPRVDGDAVDSESTGDGGAVVDGAKADVLITEPNLLMNGDFSLGCASEWIANTAAVRTENATAHSPSKSCQVCGSGAGGWSYFQKLSLSGGATQRYMFDAWVRTAPNGEAGAASVSCLIEVFDKNHVSKQRYEGPSTQATTSWEACSASLLVNAAAAGPNATLELVVVGNTANSCYLVDDATLTVVP